MCLCVHVHVYVCTPLSVCLSVCLSLFLSLYSMQSTKELWQQNLAKLEQQYAITNVPLLVKSSCVLFVVILLFFLANVIPSVKLELGW